MKYAQKCHKIDENTPNLTNKSKGRNSTKWKYFKYQPFLKGFFILKKYSQNITNVMLDFALKNRYIFQKFVQGL